MKDQFYERKGYLNTTEASHQIDELDQIDLSSPIIKKESKINKEGYIKDSPKKQIVINENKSQKFIKNDISNILNGKKKVPNINSNNYNSIAEIGIGSASNSINSHQGSKDNIDDDFGNIIRVDQKLNKVIKQNNQYSSQPVLSKKNNFHLPEIKNTTDIKQNQQLIYNKQQINNQQKIIEVAKVQIDTKLDTSIKQIIEQSEMKQNLDHKIIQQEYKSNTQIFKAPIQIDNSIKNKIVDKSQYQISQQKQVKKDKKNTTQERKTRGFQLKNNVLQKSKFINRQNTVNNPENNKIWINKHLISPNKQIFPQNNLIEQVNGEVISTERVLKGNFQQEQNIKSVENNRNEEKDCCSCDIF